MHEIQRYRLSINYGTDANGEAVPCPAITPAPCGRVTTYTDHLADKTAALEAQAEGHETKLALIERLHQEEIVFLKAQQGEPLAFRQGLTNLINRCSVENRSETADYILAQFLDNCLGAWNSATIQRDVWREEKKDA